MDMPEVFNKIRMNQAPAILKQLKKIPSLTKNNIKRFFDVLHPSSKFAKLAKRQMAYHLVTLTALGQKVRRLFIEGFYQAPLIEDVRTKEDLRKFGVDDPYSPDIPDNLYTFFGSPNNSKIRQKIWNAMISSEFIDTKVKNVIPQGFYNPNKILKNSSKALKNLLIS